MLRALVCLVALTLAVASTFGPAEPPEADSCADAAETDAAAVAVGRDGDGTFSPLASGDVVNPVQGLQGSDMLPVRFLIEGLDADCVAQRTEVRYCPPGAVCSDGGETIATSDIGLRTYEHTDGRITDDHFLILGVPLEIGGELTVDSSVAGASDSVVVVIGEYR